MSAWWAILFPMRLAVSNNRVWVRNVAYVTQVRDHGSADRAIVSRLVHPYRSGIPDVLAFGGCGGHVPSMACVFFYKYMMAAGWP